MNRLLFLLAALSVAAAAMAEGLSASEKDNLYVLTGLRDDTGGERRKSRAIAPITDEVRRKYAIREVVLMFDAEYDFNWVADEDRLREFFSARGVPVLSVCNATKWLDAKIAGTADGTALVMGNGVVPDTWLSKPWGDSRIVRYLRGGGRIVWAGDIIFAKGQGETGGMFGIGGTFGKDAFRLGGFLGMRIDRATMYGKYEKPIEQTAKSKAWGLEKRYGLVRPVLNDGILDPFVQAKDGSFADSGQICLKRENPLSGIVYLSAAVSGTDAAMLRDMWRCAWWSGTTVAVPVLDAVSCASSASPALTFGDDDLRSVFLRGEQVRVGVKANGAKMGEVKLALVDEKGETLRKWSGGITGDGPFASFDLRGLRRGVYVAVLDIAGITVRRELRVAPPVDKKGLSVSIWANFPKPVSRMRRQFKDDILDYGIEPLPNETSLAAAYDWALWCGVPFVARRMPDSMRAWAPEGYDNWMRRSDGSIRPIIAEGNRPASLGYDNPWRRQLQADLFRDMGRFDAAFPAYRGVTFTADDYSQWFGVSWNRFAVEGFRNRYGIDLPKGRKTDARGSSLDGPAEGVVSDDDPAVLGHRWFAETHADAAKRMSDALKEATGGVGRAAPIPGGMSLPMNMWSAMNPSVGFGPGGWSQASFYYYNAYWQPFTANTFWTIAARMGDRRRSVWVMPDCYVGFSESYYAQNLWHLLAGGTQGLGYFNLSQRTEASKKTLRMAGGIAKRLGVFLNALEPVRASSVLVMPYENMISVPERWHRSVIVWSNLALGGIDVDPVAADEDWEDAQTAFLFNVRTLTKSSKDRLVRFQRRGGTIIVDEATARVLPLDGIKIVSSDIALCDNVDFDSERTRAAVAALGGSDLRPVASMTHGVFARRYVDGLGNRVCWFVDTVGGDLWREFHSSTRGGGKGDKTIDDRGGYGKSFTAEVAVNERVGPVAWDVFGRKALAFSNGRLSFGMRRWGARLVAFLPEAPVAFKVSAPTRAHPGVLFKVTVETSGKCVVPFTVSAVDPSGRASEEYRGRILSDGKGSVSMPIEFAVNDMRGKWTFNVRNEFTGESLAVETVLGHNSDANQM